MRALRWVEHALALFGALALLFVGLVFSVYPETHVAAARRSRAEAWERVREMHAELLEAKAEIAALRSRQAVGEEGSR